jgi:hypothetical protein
MRWLRTLLAGSALAVLFASPAGAQVGAPVPCGPTSVGAVAAPITYPAPGAHGPTYPHQYVTIVNPSAATTIWVSPTGTAVVGASGSFPLTAGGSATWYQPQFPPPATISVISASGSVVLTCYYQ